MIKQLYLLTFFGNLVSTLLLIQVKMHFDQWSKFYSSSLNDPSKIEIFNGLKRT